MVGSLLGALGLGGATAGTLAYRLIVVGDRRGSHRDHVDSETAIVAPSLRWRPNADTEVIASAEWIRHDYTFERGFPGEAAFLDGRPRAVTVLHQPRLAAVQVWRELNCAAERLGLPKITMDVARRW